MPVGLDTVPCRVFVRVNDCHPLPTSDDVPWAVAIVLPLPRAPTRGGDVVVPGPITLSTHHVAIAILSERNTVCAVASHNDSLIVAACDTARAVALELVMLRVTLNRDLVNEGRCLPVTE